MAAMYVIENGAGTYYFPQTDHLGSILKVFDYSGNIVAEQSFDAWGRRRNPSNWTYNNIPTVPKWLIRGYTGHEHLDENGLINMNGRMYDPILGRMLSPDNYVQAADFSQNYNRYSYVLNNPLKYNDPSGELWNVVLGVAGGYLGGVAANDFNFNPLQWDYDDSATWMGIYQGASLGYGIGSGIDTHLAQKASIDPHGNINPDLLASNDGTLGVINLKREAQVIATRKYSIFIDPITPNGINMERALGQTKGFFKDGIFTLGGTGTIALGMLGFSVEAGIVMDFRNGGLKAAVYNTYERAVGIDISGGGILNYHKPIGAGEFGIQDLDGIGGTGNIALGNLDFSLGGNAVNESLTADKLAGISDTYHTYGVGYSKGLPLGISINKGYTKVSPTVDLDLLLNNYFFKW